MDADTAGRLHGVGMGGTRCRAGAGAHNQRLLHARLLPGTYALWLYLPTPKPALPKSAVPPTTNFPDASVFTEEEAAPVTAPAAGADAQAAPPIAGLPCVPFDLELRLRYEAACASPNRNP